MLEETREEGEGVCTLLGAPGWAEQLAYFPGGLG